MLGESVPSPLSSARHWTNLAFGIASLEPLGSVIGADHGVQVLSGRAELPVLARNARLPDPDCWPRQLSSPHFETEPASCTGDWKTPCAASPPPIRVNWPELLVAANNASPDESRRVVSPPFVWTMRVSLRSGVRR